MIQGAIKKGHGTPTIFRSLRAPMPDASDLDSLPLRPEQLREFAETLARQDEETGPASEGAAVDLDDLRIDPASFARLQRNIKWLVQDDFYGLTPTPCKVGTFLVMAELILPSNTLAGALQRGFRFYEAVTDDLHFTLHRGERFAEVQIELVHPELDEYHFLSEWFLLIWHRLSCWLIGEKIPIHNAEFAHAPGAPMSEYAQIFSSHCRFHRPRTLIRFNSLFLDKHCTRTVEDLKTFVRADSLDLLYIPGMDNPLAPRIETQLEHHFKQTREFLSMEEIAGEYHVSSQTLRRRLDEEGTSFRLIKEKIRRNAVMQWLNDPDVAISEIAHMTGFAEANGLSRAVKGWIGESPSEYRARIGIAPPEPGKAGPQRAARKL